MVAIAAAWFLAVVAGFLALWMYKLQPGPEGANVPRRWPIQSSIHASADRATLVLFAHPRCACTRATIAELARLMARFQDRLDAHVLFTGSPADELERTELWASAARIPGVAVAADPSGAEARRFGAGTSGAAVLYDSKGTLAFHGGITPARGHEGDSFGLQRIAAVLTGGKPDRADAPVFGCALNEQEPVRVAGSNSMGGNE
jgi:hypothetical protein